MKKSVIDIKADAREHLLGRYGSIVFATLLVYAATAIITLPFSWMVNTSPNILQYVIYFAANFLIFSVATIFRGGLWRMHLKAQASQDCDLRDCAYALKCRPNRFMNAGLLLAIIKIGIPIPAYMIGRKLILSIWQSHQIDIHMSFIFLILVIVTLIIYVWLSLKFALVLPILANSDELECREAFAQSNRLMKGNKLRLLVMMISFIGMILLGILSFFIAFLWIRPYIHQSVTEFYKSIDPQQ